MEFNPYESPASAEAAPDRSHDRAIPPFVSAHLRAQVAMALLGLNLVLSILIFLCNLSQAHLLERATMAGAQITVEEATSNDTRINLLAVAKISAYLLCAVAFVVWMHRAHGNLGSLGAERLEYTPGWAVGSWFVPFLNLVRPYQIVREVWLASNPKFVGDKGWRWRNGQVGPLLGIWWASWLLTNFMGVGVAQFTGASRELPHLRDASYVIAAQQLMFAASAALAIALVRGIDNRQTLAYDRLTSQADTFAAHHDELPS
jgi:hypothetical protein